MKYKLTPEEQEIEEHADKLKSVGGETRGRVENILNRARKSRAISLRVADLDLDMIKKRAETEGLPYQTLINIVLHKYVTEQLYEKDELRKLLSEIEEIRAM